MGNNAQSFIPFFLPAIAQLCKIRFQRDLSGSFALASKNGFEKSFTSKGKYNFFYRWPFCINMCQEK